MQVTMKKKLYIKCSFKWKDTKGINNLFLKPVALAPLDWTVPTHVTRTVKEMNRVILSPEFVIKVAKKDGVVLCVVKVNINF